jgi:hypothetical protein
MVLASFTYTAADQLRIGSKPAMCDARDALFAQLPSYGAIINLSVEWVETAKDVQAKPPLFKARGVLYDCLASRSELSFNMDVPNSFLDAVNTSMADDGDASDLERYSRTYADCGAPYFRQFKNSLTEPRKEFVLQHGGELQKFASELTAAGYSA